MARGFVTGSKKEKEMNELIVIIGLSLSGLSNMEAVRVIPNPSIELLIPYGDGEFYTHLSSTKDTYVSVGVRSGGRVKAGIGVMIFQESFGLEASARINKKFSPTLKAGFTKQYFLIQAGISLCFCN
jgi:hypothetical protein